MAGKAEIEIARLLFEEGWGGPDSSAPLQYMTDDVVMRDILGHAGPLRGHDAVRNFWQAVAGGLKVMPEEYFSNERGVALTWMAYIQLRDDSNGPENKGKWVCGEGMSRLEFRDGKVCLEIDYWNGPQGRCDDWKTHLEARRAMTPEERGATPGT
jgi:hypothetical protein